MAIGRYHEFGQTDPTSNFFKLDYQMLAQPVLKADQEYKETQAAYDSYLQRLSTQEVHPEDIGGLMGRITNLQQKEKMLRESAEGDILAPVYQEGIRSLFANEMKDPWYRKAAFQWNKYNEWNKFKQDYVLRTGDYPEPWQDTAASYWTEYKGVDTAKELAPAGIIEPRIPYTEEATKYAKEAINKKMQDSG